MTGNTTDLVLGCPFGTCLDNSHSESDDDATDHNSIASLGYDRTANGKRSFEEARGSVQLKVTAGWARWLASRDFDFAPWQVQCQ